jgi:hypothetical protein
MIYSLTCQATATVTSSGDGLVKCSDGTNPTFSAVAYAIDNTDPETGFSDGAVLGSGVVLAMVLAYGVHLLRRSL